MHRYTGREIQIDRDREGGREGRTEGEREGGREGGREGEREGGREGGREGAAAVLTAGWPLRPHEPGRGSPKGVVGRVWLSGLRNSSGILITVIRELCSSESRSPEREDSSCPSMMHLFLFKLCTGKSPSLQGVAAMLVFTRHVPPAFYVKVGLCVVVV